MSVLNESVLYPTVNMLFMVFNELLRIGPSQCHACNLDIWITIWNILHARGPHCLSVLKVRSHTNSSSSLAQGNHIVDTLAGIQNLNRPQEVLTAMRQQAQRDRLFVCN